MKHALTSWLARWFERFIALKQASGSKYTAQAALLRQFDAYLTKTSPAPPLHRSTVVAFLASLAHLTPRGRDNMVSVVWGALQYAQMHDARIERLPPRPSAAPSSSRLRAPRLVSRKEVGAILEHARRLTSRKRTEALRGATYATLFGLLWTTGLRISEAVALDVGDVDADTGLLTVRRGKFGKSRILPLKASTVAALSRYLNDHRRLVGREATAPLFVSGRLIRLTADASYRTFRKLCSRASLDKPLPTPHHLRHSFTVLRVLSWYRKGSDINALLPILSTYLGHTSVQNTRTYLRQNGLLLEEACNRFSAACDALDEVLS